MAKFEAQLNFSSHFIHQINIVFDADTAHEAHQFGKEIGKCFQEKDHQAFALMVYPKDEVVRAEGSPPPSSQQAEADRGVRPTESP